MMFCSSELPLSFMLYLDFSKITLRTINVRRSIDILPTVKIDFFGAIIPLILSFVMLAYLFKVQKFSRKKYFRYFLLAVVISIIFSRATSGAIVVYYQTIGLLISIISCVLGFYNGKFQNLILEKTYFRPEFTLLNYSKSMLFSYSLGSLACIMTDILWLPFTTFSMYIGGMGLEDGIVLIGIYSVLSTLLMTPFLRLLDRLMIFHGRFQNRR